MLLFTVASVAIHAFTLLSWAPSGNVNVALTDGGALHATLLRRLESSGDGSRVATSDPPGQTRTATGRDAARYGSDATARAAGAPGLEVSATTDGLELPLPDTWYAADELDVRAEPLTAVPLHYPPQLAGSGIRARARIVLHVDERGTVQKAAVVAATPDALFGEAARSAWLEVRFSPAMKNGGAVKSRKLVEVDFDPQ